MTDHPKDLAGRKALVTGSATGLGECIATRLAARGADIIINCTRSVEEAEATVAACQALGSQARLVVGDVSTEEGCKALADAAGLWGRLDILVNNAGITRHARDHSDLDALSKVDFMDTYAVNVAGPFLMLQACKGLLMAAYEQSGRPSAVLNVSSIAGGNGCWVVGGLCGNQGCAQHDDLVTCAWPRAGYPGECNMPRLYWYALVQG